MARYRLGLCGVVVVCALAASKSDAQTHGVHIGKTCESPKCVGEALECRIEIGHFDGYGDTIRILEAWDVVNPGGADCAEDDAGEPPVVPGCRIPALGNLPITAVSGNTTCTVGGSLPCDICAGGRPCGGGAAISDNAGVVTFLQNEYVAKAGETRIEDQANVLVRDLCDAAGLDNCSTIPNRVQFTAATSTEGCCGNDIREDDETCDGDEDDTCTMACRPDGSTNECTCCGDDMIQTDSGETCDSATFPSTAPDTHGSCRNNCTFCGDAIVNGGEQCDDGNAVDDDDCHNDCTFPHGFCRVTGGGNDESSPWPWDGTYGKGVQKKGRNSEDRYTFGGQAGAPTGSQPQPFGEWTHAQHSGPSGRFTFHAGTASAPDETEIDRINCCDAVNCNPARPAPFKQIDFAGVGQFKNIAPNTPILAAGAGEQETFHWFEVNIDDLGEPGNKPEPGANCPARGFTCETDPGGFAKCDCADFYRITIYSLGDSPEVNPRSVVIYSVEGYIIGGNFQIHPPLD